MTTKEKKPRMMYVKKIFLNEYNNMTQVGVSDIYFSHMSLE